MASSKPQTYPARASKLVEATEAAALVRPGDHVAVGGIWSQNAPTGLVRALIRAGAGELTVSGAPATGFAIDLLVAAGRATKGWLPNVTFEHLGLAPGFRAAVEAGTLHLVECDEATLVGGYRAAAAGLPYTPIASLAGTELESISPWLGSSSHGAVAIQEVPALAPDVVFLHAQEGDIYGNVRQLGTVFADRLLAKAAKRAVVVSVDRLIDNEEIRRDPRSTTIPSYFVTHVVELPLGAHPCASHGRYLADEAHIRHYMEAVKSIRKGDAAPWRGYLEAYVEVAPDDYLSACGGVGELLSRLGEGRPRG